MSMLPLSMKDANIILLLSVNFQLTSISWMRSYYLQSDYGPRLCCYYYDISTSVTDARQYRNKETPDRVRNVCQRQLH